MGVLEDMGVWGVALCAVASVPAARVSLWWLLVPVAMAVLVVAGLNSGREDDDERV